MVNIEIIQGDITEADVEAIVNAANNHLWMGSGVAGAIKTKGGVEIEEDAIAKGPIEVGGAIDSIAGKLPYKCIIHAAGMGQDLKTDQNLVYKTTVNSLLLADKIKLKSIAFPAIGTGVGGLAIDKCAEVMLQAAFDLKDKFLSLETIQFVLFDKSGYDAFISAYKAQKWKNRR